MPTFKYQARNQVGENVAGSLVATSEQAVVDQLRSQNLTVVTVREDVGRREIRLFGTRKAVGKVKLDDMVLFTRQLSTMISAGIPLVEGLEILEDQVENKGFRNVIGTIVGDVRSGADFSSALAQHPRIFNDLFVSMVRAGEVSGQLDEILVRLAEFNEATSKLRREIKSAMTYPVVSLTLVISITVFLMVGIVPKFKEIFDSLGLDLNPLTKTILAVSMWMRGNFVLMLGIIVAAVAALWILATKTKQGRYYWDWLKLQMPIFGPLFQKVAISRFSRTFATLIKSGVPMLGALEIVSATTGNKIVSDSIDAAKESVRQGEPLATPLEDSKVFPTMVVRMISVGERSGALEQLLEKISEFYDQQVTATIEALTSLIEPLMIAIMGVLVGTIVLSIFLPIIQIQKALAESA